MSFAALLSAAPALSDVLGGIDSGGVGGSSTPYQGYASTGATSINVGGINATPNGQILSIGSGGDSLGSKVMLGVIVAVITAGLVKAMS